MRGSVFTLETWRRIVKRFWPWMIAGVFLLILANVFLFWYAIQPPTSSFSGADISASDDSTASSDRVFRRLDGIRVDPDAAELLPFAVMVELHTDARPLSGISQASLVMEAPVEGGITRLLAVYDASTTVDQIGPVRSARPYFLEWAQALNAVYAHVGGSPEALNRIKGLSDFYNLDEMTNDSFFWRDLDRVAPHQVYTSAKKLQRAATLRSWVARDFSGFSFKDPEGDPGSLKEVRIPYDGYYRVRWEYDAEKDIFERYLGDVRQKDADGARVDAKNVLVLKTEQRVLDDVGRLQIRTTGSGEGVLYQHGFCVPLDWSRSSGEFYTLQDKNGEDVFLHPGVTWVEIVTLDRYQPVAKGCDIE